MDIVEVRRRFESYASGNSSEAELRAALSEALRAQPQLAPAYTALATAFFRATPSAFDLRDSLLRDIDRIAGGPQVPPPRKAESESQGIDNATVLSPRARAARAAQRPEPVLNADPAPLAPSDYSDWAGDRPGGIIPGATPTPSIDRMDTGTGTGTGTGSAWDSPERLSEPAEALVVGSVLRGRYELESELGRGGMGVVYKALDLANAEYRDSPSYVAVKVLSEEFKRHPLAIKALAREAKKALKLAHPNVVTVYNFTRDGGNVFMVMELLEGRSLDQILKTEGASGLPPARVSSILLALGEALSYAHEQGIVHADFKPSNAFLTNEGVVKVLDFGIARAVQGGTKGDDKTLFDVSLLHAISPAYASLEMHNGEPPDPRDDVYSLACVAYELLTGRHPFNRIDAAKARDAKLQPARVRGLPRNQWAALRHALAFERANRTSSVAAFIAAFEQGPRNKIRIGALAAVALAVIAVAAAVIVPRQLESFQARKQAGVIASAGTSQMPGLITQLQAAPASFRDRVLIDDKARERIISYYQRQITDFTMPSRLEFAKADATISELKRLLPDSSMVNRISHELAQSRDAELTHLLTLRDRAAQRSVLIPEQGSDSLHEVLTSIRQIDPSHKALTDPAVAKQFQTAAKSALDTNHTDMARLLVVAGVSLAPNDSALLDLQDRVEREVQRVANVKRQAELEQRLAGLNPASSDFLDKVLASREDVTAMVDIAPDSAVIKRIEASLGSVVALRVKQRLAMDDVAGAQALMLNIGDLMPEAAVNAQRDLIKQAAAANQSKAFDTLERLRRAALTGRLGKTGTTGALDLYAQLQRTGASSGILADARDYLAYGYLKDARQARFAGDRQRAAAQLAAAGNFQPSATIQGMLTAEQQLLNAAAEGAKAQPASEIDAARGRFAQALRSTILGPAELSTIALALDRLESLQASPQEISSGVGQVEDRVLQEVQRLKQQPGADPEQLARQAAIVLPASDRLAAATKEFRDADAASVLRARLDTLLKQPSANESWAADVKGLVQKIGGMLPANDEIMGEARRIPAATFIRAASDARSSHRPKDEQRLVAMAREFDPDARLGPDPSAAIVQARSKQQSADAAAASASADQSAVDKQRNMGIDALKERLENEAAAGDVVNAGKTANALRTVLYGNIYVVHDLPELMISAYVHHAKNQFAGGKIRDALQTLAAGARSYGDTPEIRSLRDRYTPLAEQSERATSPDQGAPRTSP